MVKMDKNRYILAGILTILIFSLGLLLGIILDLSRARWAENVLTSQEINFNSISLQYQLIDLFSKNNKSIDSCKAIQPLLTDAVINLNKALAKFMDYKENARIDPDKEDIIERQYLLANIRYWLLIKRYKEECNNSDVVTILYFFSNDCRDCPDQGVILTYYKKLYENKLLVFPINVDLEKDEPLITSLRMYYNISSYPTIVIGDKAYRGVVDKEALGFLICKEFGNCS